jgi:hypothetical protein
VKLKDRVLASYDRHDHDDVSTERLLQMVADDCNVGIDVVVDILVKERGE